VYILGALLGALALPAWLSLCTRRDIWILLGTFVAFVLAQSMNHASWQRYHEPMLLVMIILIIARSRVIDDARVRVMIGVVLLSAMLGALTIVGLSTAEPYTPIENPLESLSQLD
jgi:uncharacterized membrane protein YgdD (TMEM256/DUF423 family)